MKARTIPWESIADWYKENEQVIRDVMKFEGLRGAVNEVLRIAPEQPELAALREELAEEQLSCAALASGANLLHQRLAAAEQRNADLTQALERGKLWLELFRAWFGDYGVSQEDHAAIIRTLRGLPHPPSEFDKPTESGASE